MSFFKKHPVITLLILLALVIVLLVSTVGRRDMNGVESAVGNVASVPSSGFNRFTYNVGNWFRVVFGISDMQKENAELQARNMQLEGQVAGLNELEQENERLRKLANYVEENQQYDIITARVAGKSPGYWFSGFTINRGRDHGLAPGQVVVDYTGHLIGRIGETGGNWSKVESIIDPNSHVSALVERTRDIIMVRGTASVTGNDDDRLCEGYFIPLDNDLLPGDIIVTSGLDTGDGILYPKGLVIGEVTSVDVSASSVERTASIQPRAQFSSLEEVIVIKGLMESETEAEGQPGEGEAQGEDGAQDGERGPEDVDAAEVADASSGDDRVDREDVIAQTEADAAAAEAAYADEGSSKEGASVPLDFGEEPQDLNPNGDALPRGLLDSLGEVAE